MDVDIDPSAFDAGERGWNAAWVDVGSTSGIRDAWILDRDARGRPCGHIADLFEACRMTPTLLDGPTARAYRACGVSPADLPPLTVMPPWKARQELHELLRDVVSVLTGPDRGFYLNVLEPTRRLLRSLVRCPVDVERVAHHSRSGDGNVEALESFTPESDGLTRSIVYDPLRGRTGRLVVASGPQVLTLKREHRDVLRSRWDGGRVMMLDYVSLEARIAAYEAGLDPADDVYTDLAARVLGGTSRSTAKLAVIATLYGAGPKLLEDQVEPGSARWLVDRIREQFRVRHVARRLEIERAAAGFIRSRFGRRVPCCDHREHIVYNSYVQSTGVDAALTGFAAVVREMRQRHMRSAPIFLLHDAMIVDFHPDELGEVNICSLCDVGSEKTRYPYRLPLRLKELTE